MKKKMVKKRKVSYGLTEVVSVVSHQLKTPLSVIKGYLEVLLSGDLGELNKEQKEYLGDVLENTNQMIDLVKDILDVTIIEAHQIELKPVSTDLVKLIREIIQDFALLAKARNCQLSFETENKIPKLNIDPNKIRQVVSNLVSNAILYNKRRGQVEATIAQKANKVVFCCHDKGIGVSKEEKSKIFTKFFRSERVLALATGGSGLGLFISQAIIKKSGGKIWFKSKKGQGSTFCFSLPIKR